jgi:hypothetical protein
MPCDLGFTLDDFTNDDLSPEDHSWLDQLTQECAIEFAAEQGYDLRDYIHGGCVADWWGFTWMILVEARGVLPRRSGPPRGAGTARGRGGVGTCRLSMISRLYDRRRGSEHRGP